MKKLYANLDSSYVSIELYIAVACGGERKSVHWVTEAVAWTLSSLRTAICKSAARSGEGRWRPRKYTIVDSPGSLR